MAPTKSQSSTGNTSFYEISIHSSDSPPVPSLSYTVETPVETSVETSVETPVKTPMGGSIYIGNGEHESESYHTASTQQQPSPRPLARSPSFEPLLPNQPVTNEIPDRGRSRERRQSAPEPPHSGLTGHLLRNSRTESNTGVVNRWLDGQTFSPDRTNWRAARDARPAVRRPRRRVRAPPVVEAPSQRPAENTNEPKPASANVETNETFENPRSESNSQQEYVRAQFNANIARRTRPTEPLAFKNAFDALDSDEQL